jgi:hypothetical protein
LAQVVLRLLLVVIFHHQGVTLHFLVSRQLAVVVVVTVVYLHILAVQAEVAVVVRLMGHMKVVVYL